MSLLFKKVDDLKTREKVNEFLTDDLEHLLLMSGHNLTDLKSPNLSATPAHSNAGNGVEDRLIRGINAEAIVKAIAATINHLPHDSKEVLTGLYIERLPWLKVQQRLYCEHNKLGYTRRRALYDFADAFDKWQRYYNCEPIIDLHVWY